MKGVKTIFKREFTSYFKSPVGYVILMLYFFFVGIFFSVDMLFAGRVDLGGTILNMQLILLVLIPIITMRAFSEDRRTGVDVLLLTSPITVFEVVLGKFMASLAVFALMTSTTLIHLLFVVGFGGTLDAKTLGAYLGFIFIGAAYLAIGVFASSLTENQLISFLITLGIILGLLLFSVFAGIMGNLTSTLLNKVNIFNLKDIQIDNIAKKVTQVLDWPNPSTKLGNLGEGIFELVPLVYFVSLVAIFIYLTVRVVEKRRWSQK